MKKIDWSAEEAWDNRLYDDGRLRFENDVLSPINIVAETGRENVSTTIDDGSVATANFSSSYDNPVVAVYMATDNGGQFVGTRVRNVTSDSCELFMEEPDDESHSGNDLHYIVVESGRHTTPEGVTIEAGIHNTSTVRWNGGGGFDTVSFSESFSSTPAVLHSLNTYDNGEFMATAASSTGTSSFDITQEALETGHQSNAVAEDIAWIAVDTGSGTLSGYTYEAGTGSDGNSDGHDDSSHTVNYTESYSTTPDAVVSGQTMNGGDGFVSRGGGINSTSLNVYASEDQIGDSEQGHTDETFGWFIIEPDAEIEA